MFIEREILSTLDMLESEHPDLRTVTLSIDLSSCVSHDSDRFKENIRRHITFLAKDMAAIRSAADR